MSSQITLGVALHAFIPLACFIWADSDRQLASRIMAVYGGVSLLVVLPVTTALLADRLGAGTAMGAAIGGLLILLCAALVEGLWRRRRWVMLLLGFVAVLPGTMLFLQIVTGEPSKVRFLSLLGWVSMIGFCVLQLRNVEDAAEPNLAEPETDDVIAGERAI